MMRLKTKLYLFYFILAFVHCVSKSSIQSPVLIDSEKVCYCSNDSLFYHCNTTDCRDTVPHALWVTIHNNMFDSITIWATGNVQDQKQQISIMPEKIKLFQDYDTSSFSSLLPYYALSPRYVIKKGASQPILLLSFDSKVKSNEYVVNYYYFAVNNPQNAMSLCLKLQSSAGNKAIEKIEHELVQNHDIN